jgi:hypothetical protein
MTMNHNPNKRQTEAQKVKMLEALLDGKELTGFSTLKLCGSMKASSRIGELRKMCFNIQDRWITLENGKKVKSYKM